MKGSFSSSLHFLEFVLKPEALKGFLLYSYHAYVRHHGVSTVSKLAEFRAAERELQEQLAQLEELKTNAGLKKEIEFEEKLTGLMQSYGKGLKDVIAIFDPAPAGRRVEKAVGAHRRPRVLKRYKNPHSGEVVETKGGNHRVLKEWNAQYGASTVESWLQA